MNNIIAPKRHVFFITWVIFFLSCFIDQLQAQTSTLVTFAEAEDGILTGVNIATTKAGYSGTGYITGFDNANDKLKVIVTVPDKALYKIVIRHTNGSYKEQYVSVNTDPAASVKFETAANFTDTDAGVYLFNKGANSITIKNFWGYVDFDKISVFTTVKNTYTITKNLVDVNINPTTKALYDTLLSYFGKKIISGQTDSFYDIINTKTGRKPRLRAWDFQHYTEGYPYLWNNTLGGHSFGAEDDGSVQEAIDWYNSTNKKGIVSFQWHWHSPSGGVVSTNTFYSIETTFDVTQAVIAGTPEHTLIIRDIDAIAVQLKRFQTADVPILWRPLHEAGGRWFWWGEKGPEACKALYSIIYDRLKNFHSLHNLIWVWSTPEKDWYPGNDKVDIVGHDSYPGLYNYGMQKNVFDELHRLVNGEKLIAMSENGPIPDPEICLTLDAPWLYFMSWSNLVTEQNSNWHLWEVYQYPHVLSFPGTAVAAPTPDPEPEPDPDLITAISETTHHLMKIYPNPVKGGTLTIEGNLIERVDILTLDGSIVMSIENPGNSIDTREYASGFYIVRVYKGSKTENFKLVISN